MRTARTVMSGLALLTVAITGCSSKGPTTLPPVPLISQAAGATADLTLPLDSYELSPEGNLQVQRAVLDMLRDCMSSFGLSLVLPDVHPARYPTHATALSWLGAYDVEKYGYRGPPGFVDEMSAAARRGSQPIIIPNDATPVFFGNVTEFSGKAVPDGGCDGESQRKLNRTETPPRIAGLDPATPPEQGIQGLEEQASDHARADSRFQEVVSRWSGCMSGRGYRYASPDHAQSDPRWTDEGETTATPPSRDEIDTAVADRTCRQETNVSGALKYLVSEQENRLIHTHAQDLRQVSALLKTRAQSAATILDVAPIR